MDGSSCDVHREELASIYIESEEECYFMCNTEELAQLVAWVRENGNIWPNCGHGGRFNQAATWPAQVGLIAP